MLANHRKRVLFAAALAIATISAQAEIITWNGTTVTHMANDGVAANNFAQLIPGSVHEARHVDNTAGGADADGDVAVNDTVHGRTITFVAYAITGNQFGANAVNTGNANFDGVLKDGLNNPNTPTEITLGSVNPLTVGTTYAVQIWSHYGGNTNPTYRGDEAVGTTFSGQISGGTSPLTGNGLTDNPWFITGNFVASGTTQTVRWTGANNPWDAYMVTVAPVPEPGTNVLMAMAASGLLWYGARKRK